MRSQLSQADRSSHPSPSFTLFRVPPLAWAAATTARPILFYSLSLIHLRPSSFGRLRRSPAARGVQGHHAVRLDHNRILKRPPHPILSAMLLMTVSSLPSRLLPPGHSQRRPRQEVKRSTATRALQLRGSSRRGFLPWIPTTAVDSYYGFHAVARPRMRGQQGEWSVCVCVQGVPSRCAGRGVDSTRK